MKIDAKVTVELAEAGKRMADGVALHKRVLTKEEIAANRFMAISLEDGSVDATIYESRADAIRHTKVNTDANKCAYVLVPMDWWSAKTCTALLRYWRGCYDHGYRPDTSHQGAGLILPQTREGINGYGITVVRNRIH